MSETKFVLKIILGPTSQRPADDLSSRDKSKNEIFGLSTVLEFLFSPIRSRQFRIQYILKDARVCFLSNLQIGVFTP